jgi:hypothetical protein
VVTEKEGMPRGQRVMASGPRFGERTRRGLAAAPTCGQTLNTLSLSLSRLCCRGSGLVEANGFGQGRRCGCPAGLARGT